MKPHIFWILTDGVRNKKGYDKYGRLSSYSNFDSDSIVFKNAITSGTSTLMSMSSILTGSFSYELYPDFSYLNKQGLIYPNFINELKKEYLVHSVISLDAAGRLLFKDLLNVKLGSSEDLNLESSYNKFLSIMNNDFNYSKSNFVFIHLAPYLDMDIFSSKIMNFLKSKNLYDDSIIIFSSDHGFVNHGILPYFGLMLKPRGHSCYINKDTYFANLNIKLPSSLSSINHKVINEFVCLIDIWKTIFDYLNIKFKSSYDHSISLKPLIESNSVKSIKLLKNRIIRVDTRYFLQNYKKTRLINFNNDFLITDEIFNNLPIKFKKFYEKSQSIAMNNGIKLINLRFNESFISKLKIKKTILYNYSHSYLIKFLLNKFKNKKIAVYDLKHIKKNFNKFDVIIAIVNNPYFHNYKNLYRFCNKNNVKLIFINFYFELLKFKQINIFKDIYKNVPKEKKFFLRIGYSLILFFSKLYELSRLKQKYNFHRIFS